MIPSRAISTSPAQYNPIRAGNTGTDTTMPQHGTYPFPATGSRFPRMSEAAIPKTESTEKIRNA